ncbi:MAG: DeoR family transcriptional regulator [Spirosomataceae bacterium]
MLKKERQTFILKQINLHNRVLSSDLSTLLNVSEDTIRRDLNELDETGDLVKVHGGALSKSYHYDYSQSATYALEKNWLLPKKLFRSLKTICLCCWAGVLPFENW